MAWAKPAALSGSPASSATPVPPTRTGTLAALPLVARCWMYAHSVGLDVEHGGAAGGGGLLEEESQVAVVRRHGRVVAEVGRDAVRFTHRHAGLRLVEHVVGEHRRDAGRARVLDVVADEVAVGVPVRPAVAGVDASCEVLVAEPDRDARLQRGGSAGLSDTPSCIVLGHPAGRAGRPPLPAGVVVVVVVGAVVVVVGAVVVVDAAVADVTLNVVAPSFQWNRWYHWSQPGPKTPIFTTSRLTGQLGWHRERRAVAARLHAGERLRIPHAAGARVRAWG